MEKHDRQGFPKNRKKKRKKEKKGSNKTRYTVKVFKLYTNGDWTNSERKSNRISTWIICPVISYILNQHHKRLPEAGEFRSYRQILIILPVNVHANDNNSDSSCIGRTAACTERYTKRWGGEEGSRDNINHRALRIHATEGGCYTFHSLSLSLFLPRVSHRISSPVWSMDDDVSTAVRNRPCPAQSADSMRCNIHTAGRKMACRLIGRETVRAA